MNSFYTKKYIVMFFVTTLIKISVYIYLIDK